MFKRWITAAFGAAIVAGVFVLAPAAGAATGPGVTSLGMVGTSVTGGRFDQVGGALFLRDPSRYAATNCGVGASVSLWAADGSVVQLGASDTTGATGCDEGTVYSPAVAPFDSAHHQITTGISAFFCPAGGVCHPASAGGGFAIGQTVTFLMTYDRQSGLVNMRERDRAGNLFRASFDVGTGKQYTQARVTGDFGITPWDSAGYTSPPVSTVGYFTWRAGHVRSYSGHSGDFADWWTRHRITLVGAVGGAHRSALFDHGASFRTTLTP